MKIRINLLWIGIVLIALGFWGLLNPWLMLDVETMVHIFICTSSVTGGVFIIAIAFVIFGNRFDVESIIDLKNTITVYKINVIALETRIERLTFELESTKNLSRSNNNALHKAITINENLNFENEDLMDKVKVLKRLKSSNAGNMAQMSERIKSLKKCNNHE